MTNQSGPRRELERTQHGTGFAADQARIALNAETPADGLQAAILALATARGPDSSTCPSDAARAVAADWRPLMPEALNLARALARSGQVELSQRGKPLDPDGQWRGPIRIRLPRP
ncbi:DUF3253 domain-containing protein [Amycolatopsis sp. NPDC088138]|uniref:DUF3253 domain-containing protein n=1 Tax=Amycolatopsis sp. NPDC088138 TaxID=3363938 RepID=UPI0037FA51B8